MGGRTGARRGGPDAPIRYRGTTLGGNALSQIRRIIRDSKGQPRTRISRKVCQFFGWRRSCGAPAVESCLALLARLERHGLVQLPALRSRLGPRRALRCAPADDSIAPFFERPEVEAGRFVVRPLLLEERGAYRGLLERHHYLGWRLPPGKSLCHVAFLDREVVALVSWATATLHNSGRDAWIGWDAQARSRHLHLVATNVRFLMLPLAEPAKAEPNLASRVLAGSLRRLSADWEVMHAHPILLAETFVDGSRFRGTCYRASNWIFVGETAGWSRRGKVYSFHGKPKQVFLFPLQRRARKWLCAEQNPIDARMEGAMLLDVTRLPLEGNGGLFELLHDIKDPRKPRGVRHKAGSILALGVSAVLAGARNVAAIAQWVEDLPGEMREQLGGSRYRKPSESTFRRLLIAIDVAELDRRLGAWTARHRDVVGEGIALDGKTLRGSGDGTTPPVHLVSAVLHRDGVVLAQTRVPDKSNEIKSVEPVLSGLDIEGAVVTGDAMFTQTAIAEHIVEKKADYLFTVKDNQPGLRTGIENMGLEAFFPGAHGDEPGSRAG